MSDRSWRVFYTAARAEKKCEARLRERRIDVFLPKYETIRQWADRKKKVVEPLFRNYIFAQVDERERLAVLQTDGIVRCVVFNGEPAEVPGHEIEQLQIALRDPSKLDVIDYPRPAVGEQVIITGGPFQGLKGEVVQHRGQTHVLIRITPIRQAVRVNVQADWVQREVPLPGT